MWRSTFKIGAAQLRSVTETVLKSSFSVVCVNRSSRSIRYGFPAGAKVIWCSVDIILFNSVNEKKFLCSIPHPEHRKVYWNETPSFQFNWNLTVGRLYFYLLQRYQSRQFVGGGADIHQFLRSVTNKSTTTPLSKNATSAGNRIVFRLFAVPFLPQDRRDRALAVTGRHFVIDFKCTEEAGVGLSSQTVAHPLTIWNISKIQLVVYHQCCVLIGWATSRLYVIAH